MPGFNVPVQGLRLNHESDSKDSSQIIRLNLSQKYAEDLLSYARDGGECQLKTGRRPEISFGSRRVSLHHGIDKFPQEIFSGPLDGTKPIYFSGRLSHTLDVQQAKEATAGVDHALAALKNNLKQTQDERASGEKNFLASKLLRPQHRPSPLSGGLMGSRPSSPFLNTAGFSPRPAPTSAPLLAGQSRKDKVKFDAIKIPVIHLLAVAPQEADQVAKKLRVTRADLEPVLFKVAHEGKIGKRELKDRSYRELDVWKFPYQSQNDRQAAIEHAISAFDRQRITKSDKVWQMLLAKEDRDKGIHLTKLNFDQPLMPGNSTPKLPERSTDGGSSEGKSMTSNQFGRKDKVPTAKSIDADIKNKKVEKKPKVVAPNESVKATAKVSKEGKKEITRDGDSKKPTFAKQDVKFKSSAKVVDSDEEAEPKASKVLRTGSKPADVPSTNNKKLHSETAPTLSSRTDKATNSSSKPPLHKTLGSGLSSHNKATDRGRITPAAAMVRTRGGKDTADKASDAKTLQITSASQSRNNSRPRNGGSPTKPSPLGSSPPTNSRDVDTTSNSSKGTALSSAPSSPPSTDTSQTKKDSGLVTTYKKSGPQLNGANKRKADSGLDQPSAKRQQVTNNTGKERFNTLPKALANEIERRPKRESPDSDISTASERTALTREGIIEEAKRFHKLYTNYKTLHDRLTKVSVAQRTDDEVDRLWKQHIRLSELKDQIWKNWTNIEKLEKIS